MIFVNMALDRRGYVFHKYESWIQGITEFVNKNSKPKITLRMIMNSHDMSNDDNKYFVNNGLRFL